MNESENKKPAISKLAIAPIILGLIWIPIAFRPGPGDSPWLSSPWFLLWPAFCILLAIAAFTVIRKSGHRKERRWAIVGIILNIFLLIGGVYAVHSQRLFDEMLGNGFCAFQQQQLRAAMNEYSKVNRGAYPIPQRWCDLIAGVPPAAGDFVCRSSKTEWHYEWINPGEKPSSNEEMIFVKEQENGIRIYITKISTYAMNPNCGPNSPPDTILLFETKPGWNQSGGPELLTFDNHGGRGANVLFNDGHVEFVKPEDVSKLRWQAEETKP